MTDPTKITTVSRRTLTGLAATAGVGLPLLAACGDNSDASTGSGSLPTSTSDIDVGGGAIFADEEVVITQPTKGEFKAFSAVCTHQGCLVASVSDGTINCPCHGSRFSIETGVPEAGSEAKSPLGEVKIAVQGDQISLA
jgi:Rieske Fe-S protein